VQTIREMLATTQFRNFSFRLLSKNVKIKPNKTIILPVVLTGCETRSFTLGVFENRVLRKIFGHKKAEVT
jgi:hypothetical protein